MQKRMKKRRLDWTSVQNLDASENAQELLQIVRPTIEVHLSVQHLKELEATQMITRTVDNGDNGTMYYVKVEVNSKLSN